MSEISKSLEVISEKKTKFAYDWNEIEDKQSISIVRIHTLSRNITFKCDNGTLPRTNIDDGSFEMMRKTHLQCIFRLEINIVVAFVESAVNILSEREITEKKFVPYFLSVSHSLLAKNTMGFGA